MTKRKTVKEPFAEEEIKEFPLQPPEMHYLAERYVVRLPADDQILNDPWKLRVSVTRILEDHIGDEVQLTSIKLKRPHFLARGIYQIKGRPPQVKALVTVKF